MVHFPTGNGKYRDLIHDDDCRSYPANRSRSMSDYRFGRSQGKRVRAHAVEALRRVNGYLRNAVSSLVTFLGPSWDGPVRKYRPEDHYMRGPGPKWREKHVLDRASAGSR
jgi:hypothetical protein